jgi:hypothetical protein
LLNELTDHVDAAVADHVLDVERGHGTKVRKPVSGA